MVEAAPDIVGGGDDDNRDNGAIVGDDDNGSLGPRGENEKSEKILVRKGDKRSQGSNTKIASISIYQAPGTIIISR